ncbi:MAG: Tetratricopeptide 1 repeat-containing protein [Fibrobacteres bacterium]|nr:Tetratricopeptide 1 repeat-containing protein [Fibrobacterota bacterium]
MKPMGFLRRRLLGSIALAGSCLSAAFLLSGVFSGRSPAGPATQGTSASQASQAHRAYRSVPGEYAGRAACAECHAAEAKAYSGSDHDRAMEPAGPGTILGRFDGDSLAHPGGVSRFYREGDAFMVRAPGPDGAPQAYPVRYAFGVRPLQQYLVEFPGGRMQALATAWDTRKQAWFHLTPDSAVPPDDWLHWTGDGHNWNAMCADCHSTGLRRGYDAAKGVFHTDWKEPDVSCEACHGPGKDHVEWARAGTLKRFFLERSFAKREGADPASVGSADRTRARAAHGLAWDRMGQGGRAEIMACARCHARRSALKEDFGYALEFLDEYSPELLREGVYHADGQIQDEVYEYGSFLQSKMYGKGVHCSDCHDPHSLRTRAPGNALCTHCHEAARFDTPDHHRHATGGPGGLCVDCHMPTRTYMGADVRRDHSLRIPRPDLSARYGTPNACGQCHADRGAAWAAEKVREWHGPVRKPHFSELLAKGRSGGPGADSALAALAADTLWPAMARASAVAILAGYMDGLAGARTGAGGTATNAAMTRVTTITTVTKGARDREPLMRLASAAASEELPRDVRLAVAGPLLRDPLRAVRAAAAGALITESPLLPDSLRPDYRRALAEHRAALDANAVFPGGRFDLGRYHEKRGSDDSAALEYRAALAIDKRFLPARMNLATLYARQGRPDSAAAQLREAIRLDTGNADAHYALGLAMAEQGRIDSAAVHLASACRARPGDPRFAYNLGLLLHRLNRPSEAEAALKRSIAMGGGDPAYLYTLAWFYAVRARWSEARAMAARAIAVSPGYPGLAELIRGIERRKI